MPEKIFPQGEGWITYNVRDPSFDARNATQEEIFNDLFMHDQIPPNFKDYEIGKCKGKKQGYSITLRLIDETKFENLEIITT